MSSKILGVAALGIGLAFCAAAPARAQGTISDAPVNFVRGTSPFDTSPDASFNGVSPTLGQDHLFEFGWWFRVSGDASETVFGTPNTQSYTGAMSTLTWNDVAARGLFSAQEVATVVNVGGPSGHVTADMTVTNLSAVNPLVIEVFHMIDIDIQPTAGNDSATLALANSYIQLSDPGGNTAEYRAPGDVGPVANAYLVRPFGGTDVGAELSNGTVTNFGNTGLPFGPADFTGGFQWSATIPASGSQVFRVVLAVNTMAVPVELLSFSIE